MTPRSLREVRQDAYRDLILEAAEPVFADHGYEAARVQEIAAATGASVGTIYGVFGSKAELFGTVLTHRLPRLLEVAHAGSAGATCALERILDGLDATLRFVLAHPAWLRIHLGDHAWGLGPVRADRDQLAAWRQGVGLAAQLLGEAMDDGHVVRADPLLLARMVLAGLQVHLADWVEQGGDEPADTLVPRLRALFLALYGTPAAPVPLLPRPRSP
ncbi:MAG: TetR/AcrR family transcriptional regulator [Alphaproteobacteria bacterium]|nr:TetR/AcrR family transcriptional regulator [Alphaproteobacteria bacterium]